MYLSLVIASLFFSIFDLMTHRIPNRALLIFAAVLLLLHLDDPKPIHYWTLLIILVATPALLAVGIGAGDLRLALLLGAFYIAPSSKSVGDFLLAFSFTAFATLIIEGALRRSLAGSIALAPAICLGVIWCTR